MIPFLSAPSGWAPFFILPHMHMHHTKIQEKKKSLHFSSLPLLSGRSAKRAEGQLTKKCMKGKAS